MRKTFTLLVAAFAALAMSACRDQANYASGSDRSEAADAGDLVGDATAVVDQMKRDPDLAQLMQRARGVFIVPHYGKAAVGVGARGGEGVLLAREGTEWSGPLFYDIGAISVGPQIGASGGAIAMLLMNQQAVDSFEKDNNFSLNADAGFTLVDYSARGQASAGKGDVILWSGQEGAFAGVSLSVTDIARDEDQNRAYYDRQATPEDVFSGRIESPDGDTLRRKLQG
jgi:SH3 domain-containing YSC84-like protein 1